MPGEILFIDVKMSDLRERLGNFLKFRAVESYQSAMEILAVDRNISLVVCAHELGVNKLESIAIRMSALVPDANLLILCDSAPDCHTYASDHFKPIIGLALKENPDQEILSVVTNALELRIIGKTTRLVLKS